MGNEIATRMTLTGPAEDIDLMLCEFFSPLEHEGDEGGHKSVLVPDFCKIRPLAFGNGVDDVRAKAKAAKIEFLEKLIEEEEALGGFYHSGRAHLEVFRRFDGDFVDTCKAIGWGSYQPHYASFKRMAKGETVELCIHSRGSVPLSIIRRLVQFCPSLHLVGSAYSIADQCGMVLFGCNGTLHSEIFNFSEQTEDLLIEIYERTYKGKWPPFEEWYVDVDDIEEDKSSEFVSSKGTRRIYSIDVTLGATAYIKASSEDEALRTLDLYRNEPIYLGYTDIFCDLPLDHPHLPDFSIATAITLHGPFADFGIKPGDKKASGSAGNHDVRDGGCYVDWSRRP